MRLNLARRRICAAFLLGFGCVVSAFSQSEATANAAPERTGRNRRPLPATLVFDTGRGRLRFSDPPRDSPMRRSRTGILPLVSTATGVTQFGDANDAARLGLFSSNGQRTTSNIVVVDGIPVNLGLSSDDSSIAGNLGALPALTASGGTQSFAANVQTGEMLVKTMAAAPDQRVAGAVLEIKSRGGNNRFRGGLSEIFGNEVLNASDPFAQAAGLGRAPARLNQFGGNLGGPVVANRLWFFVGYDGLRLRQPAFATTEVPDSLARRTAFGGLREILNAFPVANGRATSAGAAEFNAVFAMPASHDIANFRLDFELTSNFRFGGRYTVADSDSQARGDRDTSLSTISRSANRGDTFAFWSNWNASSQLIFTGRAAVSRNRVARDVAADDFGGATPGASAAGVVRYDFAGRGAALVRSPRIASVVDQFFAGVGMVYVDGRFATSAGFDFRRLTLGVGAATLDRGVLFDGFAAPVAARVAELRRTIGEKPRTTDFSFYVNETVRAFSFMTLTAGLRNDADRSAGANPVNALATGGYSSRIAGKLLNLAPRFGGAVQFFNGKTVVRAGAGLFYDFRGATASDVFANSLPFASGATAVGVNYDAVPSTPLRPLIAFADDFKTPRVWHLFTEVQQRLSFRNRLTATYTSSFGSNLTRTRTFASSDPRFNYLRLTSTDGESELDSLQLRFEHRYSAGLAFTARYMLQRSRDDFSPDSLRDSIRTSADRTRDRGASDFDIRHQFGFYGAYELPVFFAEGWKKALNEDWTLVASLTSRSALPVPVGYFRTTEFGREFVRADRVGDAPFYVGEGASKTLNRAAFAIPSGDGNLERNVVRGFGLSQLDAALQRRIRITNDTRIEIGVNFRNILNQTNFADMSGNLGTRLPNGAFRANNYFGRPVSTNGSNGFTPFYLYGGPRSAEFTLRFVF